MTEKMKAALALLSLAAYDRCTGTEVKWTPAEDGEKPLPLSRRYREKLVALEEKVPYDKLCIAENKSGKFSHRI